MRSQLLSRALMALKQFSTSNNDQIDNLLSLKIILLLALGTAALSAYTAAYRWRQIAGHQKPTLAAPNLTTPSHLKNSNTAINPPSLNIERAQATQDLQNLLPRHILFTYVHYKAKKVSLAGDFNNWTPQGMPKQKIGVWRLSVDIEPGIYKYNFIVDGKKMIDPYNSRRELDSSILIVEPLEKKR